MSTSGPDGIRFVRDNIKVTKNGMCKLSEDEITPLSIVNSEEIEVSNRLLPFQAKLC